MKLTVKKEVTEEIDVPGEFPLYMMHGGDFYKFFDQESYIEITWSSFSAERYKCAYHIIPATAAKVLTHGERITEKQFLSAYRIYTDAMNEMILGETKLSKAS